MNETIPQITQTVLINLPEDDYGFSYQLILKECELNCASYQKKFILCKYNTKFKEKQVSLDINIISSQDKKEFLSAWQNDRIHDYIKSVGEYPIRIDSI